MGEPVEKTGTLGQALLGNLVLPFAGAYLYYKGTPLHTVLMSGGITFVVLNVYLLIAFKVWGGKQN
jgi:hypothetical protein